MKPSVIESLTVSDPYDFKFSKVHTISKVSDLSEIQYHEDEDKEI